MSVDKQAKYSLTVHGEHGMYVPFYWHASSVTSRAHIGLH